MTVGTETNGSIHHIKRSDCSSSLEPFRQFLPPKDYYRHRNLLGSSARQWYEDHKDLPQLKSFLDGPKQANLSKPFIGFTSDGNVINDVFDYASDEGAPVEAMVDTALHLISLMSPDQKKRTLFDSVEADETRIWSNPEFYINEGGLRLDECSADIQTAVHDLLRSSMLSNRYTKVLNCCRVNQFLGELVNGQGVLNMHSYNFRMFATPDTITPWAFTFFGHHVCIAVLVHGKRMVIGPTFLGAEPNCIDEGPHAGLKLFSEEESSSLALMRSLSPELRQRAILCDSVLPPKLPPGRWVPRDERHVGGAGQDNRVVPYEGCPVSLFNSQQKGYILELFMAFNEYYPSTVLSSRQKIFMKHLDDTYFAWVGGIGDDDAYYFRIHSPVAFMEFVFHAGIYLTNDEPAKYHIHTINRLPNGGDYGRALLKQYREWNREYQASPKTIPSAQTP